MRLHELLLEHRLSVPATFEDCWGDGPSHSFESAAGGSKRIGFVAVDTLFDVIHCRAEAVLDMDPMAKRVDHLPVMVSLVADVPIAAEEGPY